MTANAEGSATPLGDAIARRQSRTAHEVRAALDAGRTALAFQPVRDAASGRVAFEEGLIRILDEAGRIVPASAFMPQVEGDALGREIDCAALRMGLDALAADPGLRLSINMSAQSVAHRPWLRAFDAGLAGRSELARRLILEITETSAIVLPEMTAAFMTELRGAGVSFALDDFGAGHTSLRYLREFGFDLLKVDGRFVQGLAASPDDRAILGAMVGLARHFQMTSVAECVETEADARACRDLGIDCLQGYLYGAPALRADERRARAAAAR